MLRGLVYEMDSNVIVPSSGVRKTDVVYIASLLLYWTEKNHTRNSHHDEFCPILHSSPGKVAPLEDQGLGNEEGIILSS